MANKLREENTAAAHRRRGTRHALVALGLAAAALALNGCDDGSSSASTGQIGSEGADAIYFGGPILTMDDALPRAEALAVEDGTIIAVGAADDVMELRGTDTMMVELGDRALIPGFVDAHAHVVGGGLQAVGANLLAPPDGGVTDIASLQQVLEGWVDANQAIIEQYDIIIGFGYDNATLAEKRHPTRGELDAVSTDVPIYLIHQSGHFGATNSLGLERMGITAETEDPAGGIIRRQGDGEPNGVLEEYAHFNSFPKLFGKIDSEASLALIREGTSLWARFGFTTAQEGRTTPDVVALLKAAAANGALPIDVAAYVDVLAGREVILEEFSPTYNGRFRVAGGKLTIDGSPQGFTAWRDEPYYDPVGDYDEGYAGYPAVTEEQVMDAANWAYANDVQLLTHSNGEAATDLLVKSLDAAQKAHGEGDRRPVLIHGQFLRPDQIDELERLGVIPSLFPMHTFYWGDWHREHTVGPQKADNISPTGWVLEKGMIFTSHTDAPVAFPDTMRVLDATVTRRSRTGDILGAEHRVDVMTALKAMTIWPAHQHFEEGTKGSLEVGKLADLVILSADPTAVDPETIDQIRVLETIKEGATIYKRTE